MTSFWFATKSPIDLAICRIVWFGFLFLYYATADFSAWGDVGFVFWKPIWLFRTLAIGPPSVQLLEVLQVVWKISLFLCCVGLYTRVSTFVAFLLGIYLLGMQHNFGKVHHVDAVAVLTLAIMACSRCGDAISLDALWRHKLAVPSGEYRWPIRCVWLLLSMIFLAAGVAKLRTSGWEWTDPDNLRIRLIEHNYLYGGMALSNWGLYIAQYSWLCRALAIGTLVIECSLFLAMFHPYFRIVLVPAALAMLISFPLLLGPSFVPLIATFVFWVPWEELNRRVRGNHP